MSIKGIKPSYCKTSRFAKLVEMFQQLDKQFEYPNCEGYADEKRLVEHFEKTITSFIEKEF